MMRRNLSMRLGALAIVLGSCHGGAPQPEGAPVRTEESQSKSNAAVAQEKPVKPSDTPGGEPTETTLDVDGAKRRVTLQDGERMKAALVKWLRESALADKVMLLRVTERADAWIDGDGVLRVGAWALLSEHGKLVLSYRAPAGAEGAMGFVAELGDEAGVWRVSDVRPVFVHARREAR